MPDMAGYNDLVHFVAFSLSVFTRKKEFRF